MRTSVETRIERLVIERLQGNTIDALKPTDGYYTADQREDGDDGEWISVEAVRGQNDPLDSGFWSFVVTISFHGADFGDEAEKARTEHKILAAELPIRAIAADDLTDGSIGCAGVELSIDSIRERDEIGVIRMTSFECKVGEFDPATV